LEYLRLVVEIPDDFWSIAETCPSARKAGEHAFE